MEKVSNAYKEEEELKKIIGDNGVLNLYYGGYEIIVKEKKKFKWAVVFEFLFKYGFSVYVTKKDGNIQIVAKQTF